MLLTSYIPTDIGSYPPDFPWREIEDYIGPVEEMTPVVERLGHKTTFGVQAICAGVMLWGARRLESFAPARHNFELAEASFASMLDPSLIDIDAGPRSAVPDGPPALAAMVGLNLQLSRAINPDTWWKRCSQPVFNLSHMVHLTAHILPEPHRGAFDLWLIEVLARVDAVAAKPATPRVDVEEFDTKQAFYDYNAPHRGLPLPPEILDTTRAFDPGAMPAMLAQFRAGLDPASNRYLRPDALAELRARP